MSNYLENLVNRAVGFETHAVVSPSFMPSFVSETLVPAKDDQVLRANGLEYRPKSNEKNLSLTEKIEPLPNHFIDPHGLHLNETDRVSDVDAIMENKDAPSKEATSSIVIQVAPDTTHIQKSTQDRLKRDAKVRKREDVALEINHDRIFSQKDNWKAAFPGQQEKNVRDNSIKPLEAQLIEPLRINPERNRSLQKETRLADAKPAVHPSDTSIKPVNIQAIEPHEVRSKGESPFLQEKKEFKIVNIQPNLKAANHGFKCIVEPAPFIKPVYRNPRSSVEGLKEQRPVRIHIGTIEVRANRPVPKKTEQNPQQVLKPLGFNDYARIRNYINWGQR